MRFRTKIWMLPLSAGLVFLLGLLVSFAVGTRTSADLLRLGAVDTPYVQNMLKLERHIEQFRLALQSAAAEGDISKLAEVEGIVAATNKTFTAMKSLEGKQEIAEQLGTNYSSYQQAALAATRALLEQKDAGDHIQRMQSSQQKLEKLVSEQLQSSQLQADQSQEAVAQGVRSGVWINLITGCLVLCVLGFASWLTVRSVWKDLGNEPSALRDLTQRVAAGDLSLGAIEDESDDESLHSALKRMTSRLADTVHTIRDAADSITQASREIATGNLDLSDRTEKTASNLQHAASSMDELTNNVQHSAASAQQANKLANTAVQAAQNGGAIVGQVVSNMSEISKTSSKINDIIGVIDGIAFQTNILALNAAVEAARAGEQGRGFAVVASEVRALAQRSAAAAKEIKALITGSVDTVEAGAKLVQSAGSTMGEIVDSVERVSQIIHELSSASSEQSKGLGEVNVSVEKLDQMTQQNAALVEESAAAAQSLQEQASRLSDVMAGFQIR